MIWRVRATVREYPRQFWVLFVSALINAAGAGLVMDRLGGQYIWYAAFASCMLLGLGFLAMSGQVKKRLDKAYLSA